MEDCRPTRTRVLSVDFGSRNMGVAIADVNLGAFPAVEFAFFTVKDFGADLTADQLIDKAFAYFRPLFENYQPNLVLLERQMGGTTHQSGPGGYRLLAGNIKMAKLQSCLQTMCLFLGTPFKLVSPRLKGRVDFIVQEGWYSRFPALKSVYRTQRGFLESFAAAGTKTWTQRKKASVRNVLLLEAWFDAKFYRAFCQSLDHNVADAVVMITDHFSLCPGSQPN